MIVLFILVSVLSTVWKYNSTLPYQNNDNLINKFSIEVCLQIQLSAFLVRSYLFEKVIDRFR